MGWVGLRIMSQACRPCLIALRLATDLPSVEFGPVDFLALRRLAAVCFALADIIWSFIDCCAFAFCVKFVVILCVVYVARHPKTETKTAWLNP